MSITYLHEPRTLKSIGKEIYDTCEQKGFHEPIDHEIAEQAVRILLTISELCEAFEAIRKNKPKSDHDEEVADTVIRLLHYAAHEDIDIDREVATKMEKNRGRPYKHGAKF